MAPLSTLHEEAVSTSTAAPREGAAMSSTAGPPQALGPSGDVNRRPALKGKKGSRGASGGKEKKSGDAPRRKSGRESSARRRFVQAEVQAKFNSEKDVWKLQQQLVSPGVTEELMEAAKKFLEERSYKEVVEERSVDGLCGFPLCSQKAAGTGTKKWKLNCKSYEVYDQKELGMYCSLKCLRESGAFCTALDPDPAYVRSASAVAAARGAVASAVDVAERSKTSEGKVASVPEKKPSPAAETDIAEMKTLVPTVRPRAVVRFSREKQTYSVSYQDYDGGGELPLPSTSGPIGKDSSLDELAAKMADVKKRGVSTSCGPGADTESVGNAKALVSKLLRSPVIERDTAIVGHASPLDVLQNPETVTPTVASACSTALPLETPILNGPTSGEATVPGTSDTKGILAASARDVAPSVEEKASKDNCTNSRDDTNGKTSVGGKVQFNVNVVKDDLDCEDTDAISDGSSGDEHFDPDGVVQVPNGIPFVRAWGVLASWLTDQARQVMHHGEHLERDEEARPAHRGRRVLIRDLIASRVPGDLSFMSSRLEDFTFALGVHQSLPSVAESNLYDFLSSLFLRSLLRADMKRGVISPSAVADAMATRFLEITSRKFGITDEELETLVAVVDKLPSL
eukprot:TRINITY_DN49358_c0_g1_i1.p1 TRINITY_DN49358_c0_g1~~TRINITY_DN49358_c0_g1_i1.p1  ORF type:complete len:627 (-),score=108.10 TRINITY_DN49358_c0_g1_i1:151-2031(-)